jgi:hypothetical protein
VAKKFKPLGEDQGTAGEEESRALGHSEGSVTQLPASFVDDFLESRSDEPTQALLESAGRLLAVVQRS